MDITVTFTEKEATAVKFALLGARQTIHSEPHFVAPLGEAIAKLADAMKPAPAAPPEEPEPANEAVPRRRGKPASAA